MAFEAHSAKDKKYLIAAQSVWGTGVDDAAATIALSMEPFNITPDIKVREIPGAHAIRNGIYCDMQTDVKGSMPTVPLVGPAKLTELTHFLAGCTQRVVEGVTPQFSKVFTFPTPAQEPDFTDDEGHFFTIFEQDPTASRSGKLVDGIISELIIKAEKGGMLEISAQFVGRGAPTETANPTGTATLGACTFFKWYDFKRATVDFGAGAQAVNMENFEIKLAQTIIAVGIDPAGTNFQTFIIHTREPEFSLTLLKDAHVQSAKANLRSDTAITVNIGAGNATPGTDIGDLDFTYTGKLLTVPNEMTDILTSPMTGRILGADATTAPLTITLADGVEQGY